MGEDFPLDPSQVQPPHEKPVEGLLPEGQLPAAEGATPDDQAHLGEDADAGTDTITTSVFDSSASIHSDRVDHKENVDRGEPSTYVRNKAKAEEMARAQDAAHDASEQFPIHAALRAGVDYDMDTAKHKVKGHEFIWNQREVLARREQQRVSLHMRNQVLKYSSAIVENYQEHGDTPPKALEALAAVNELVDGSHKVRFHSGVEDKHSGNDIKITIDGLNRVIVNHGEIDSGAEETFILSMFGGEYKLAQPLSTNEQDFDEVVVTKRRLLKPEDVTRLKEILSPAIALRQEDLERQVYEGKLKT